MNTTGIRVNDTFKEFIKKAKLNRYKLGSDVEPETMYNICDLIVKYFKENNDSYLEFIKMVGIRNV